MMIIVKFPKLVKENGSLFFFYVLAQSSSHELALEERVFSVSLWWAEMGCRLCICFGQSSRYELAFDIELDPRLVFLSIMKF